MVLYLEGSYYNKLFEVTTNNAGIKFNWESLDIKDTCREIENINCTHTQNIYWQRSFFLLSNSFLDSNGRFKPERKLLEEMPPRISSDLPYEV